MNLIAQILDPLCINVDVALTSRAAVFEYVGAMFERQSGLPAKKVVEALTQREKLGSTGLGMGIAIPHQRMKGLKEAKGAFLRLSEAIPFDAPDGAPVSLFFIMLAPEQANETHLRLLAELAQMFSDKGFRDGLSGAPDAASIVAEFANWSVNAANERSSAI